MKKKYTDILKESLINFDDMQKTTSTVNDIINFAGKGKGDLPTHKKANNVVSVLERMYMEEDSDRPTLREGEETEIAQGEGPAPKVQPDTKEQKVKDSATKAKGAAEVSPQDKKEFSDNIQDATKDDKTLATETAEEVEEMARIPGEDDDLGESLFEEGDADLGSEPSSTATVPPAKIEENLENEPDHEAMGDDPKVKRELKIGDGGAKLSNDAKVGDAAVDGMEKESEGIPEETKLSSKAKAESKKAEKKTVVKEEAAEETEESAEETEEAAEETEEATEESPVEVPDETEPVETDDLSRLPEDGEENVLGDEDLAEPEEDVIGGGDEEIDVGEEPIPGEEVANEELPVPEEGEEVPVPDEVAGEEGMEECETPMEDNTTMAEGEEQGVPGVNSEDEEMSRIPGEDDVEGEEKAEDEKSEEEPVLDVDKATEEMRESIVAREATEETIVDRLIREMNLETESASELDEIDIDDVEEE